MQKFKFLQQKKCFKIFAKILLTLHVLSVHSLVGLKSRHLSRISISHIFRQNFAKFVNKTWSFKKNLIIFSRFCFLLHASADFSSDKIDEAPKGFASKLVHSVYILETPTVYADT